MSEICLECWNKINNSNYKKANISFRKSRSFARNVLNSKELLLLNENIIICVNFAISFFLLKLYLLLFTFCGEYLYYHICFISTKRIIRQTTNKHKLHRINKFFQHQKPSRVGRLFCISGRRKR